MTESAPRTRKGRFRPLNPQKYRGDSTNIIWRSTWELMVMRRLDSSPSVLEWSSESVVIPYNDKTQGRPPGKFRRYIPDFLVKKIDARGVQETLLIEVKPAKESPMHSRPVRGKKTERKFIAEATTWVRNECKWEAAKRFCKQRGWKFVVLTERDLGL